MDEPRSPESTRELVVDAPAHPTRRAALLMIGIVVFIVVLSLLGTR